MTRVALVAFAALLPHVASAQCPIGIEFCEELFQPPCYRAPDNPSCNSDCHCGHPDYPRCDPRCLVGEVCDPTCGATTCSEFGPTCDDRRPPCYRAPDNPECDPTCTCDSPDYPRCDPECEVGVVCDPDPSCGEGGAPLCSEFGPTCDDRRPPCYREPDNPLCNPDCRCGSPDYPTCDPLCEPGEVCDPACAAVPPLTRLPPGYEPPETSRPPGEPRLPCYRAPEDPSCNPDCHCESPDYPFCDPECRPGEICDPSCAPATPPPTCFDEFDRPCADTPSPPCYRAPDDPTCDPTCHCHSPSWPACDPECRAGDVCDPDPTCVDTPGDACWDPVLGRNVCADEPACPSGERVSFASYEGPDELVRLGDRHRDGDCATVTVEAPGYYQLFDSYVAESGSGQRDETGFLLVTNSCNETGLPLEANAPGGRWVVIDNDNESTPSDPVYMGTFFFAEGDNRVCLYHWCPLWRDDHGVGMVTAGCSSIDSIHVDLEARGFLCPDPTSTPGACSGMDEPPPIDECDRLSCPVGCEAGRCVGYDPCEGIECEHGCRYGMCLGAGDRDVDRDGDGYGLAEDCNDDNPYVSPSAPEVCGDLVDNDCDGAIDPGCAPDEETGYEPPASLHPPREDGHLTGGGTVGGTCGCRTVGGSRPMPAALVLFGLFLAWRRRSPRR